jgi:hypothetical protein
MIITKINMAIAKTSSNILLTPPKNKIKRGITAPDIPHKQN